MLFIQSHSSIESPVFSTGLYFYEIKLDIAIILIHMKDKVIQSLIQQEKARQKKVVNLIASENYISDDVARAMSSVFTNKYAEGYVGKRYYQGNSVVDALETLCISRALKLFKLSKHTWHVNVQALSGSPANLAVYIALLQHGDAVMGMSLDQGGHLTHGHRVSATGMFWKQIPYGVSKVNFKIDYDELQKIALREKPKMIIAGYTAYSRSIDWKKFREIADSCGALLLADVSHTAGLISGGASPSPFRYADVVMMTTHKTLRGPRGALLFSRIDEREIYKKIDKAVFPGLQGGPHMNTVAGIAVALYEAQQPSFKVYAKQVVKNAKVLARELIVLGWNVVSQGTDSHIVLVDTWMDGVGVTGTIAATALEQAGIIVNKNTIPYDTRKPFDPSGIRLGTAAVTTQGKKENDMKKVAKQIDDVLRRAQVKHLK